MGATEDDAARSVIAGQKPACIAGWGTHYFRTGTLTTLESQVDWIRFNVPFRLIVASALFTHARSGLPFWKTIPKCSPVVLANWPRIFEFGT